jgi:serine protease AprX
MRLKIPMLGMAVVAAALVVQPAMAAAPTGAPPSGAQIPIIVRHDAGDAEAAERAVAAAGGTVGKRFAVIDSFSATVPARRLPVVLSAEGVRGVTPDGHVTMASKSWFADATATSMGSVATTTGADTVWGRSTGKGIGVALIDSGISPVKGLAGTAKVVNGPDLSFESQASNLRYLDTFGHGTHMAGIIAGRDPEVAAGQEIRTTREPSLFVGVAPDATLINMKVAATDGAVDVSQIIAAIDWVVTHRNDAGLNIRVLNLSFGTDSVQDARLDPLSHAVEAAWRKGIVVVVAVGNDGLTTTRVSMPAANPYVIAVGASDHRATEPKGDDTVASFSTKGSVSRHADLVAPGRSIVGLRTPNSYIDSNYPTGLLSTTLDPTQRFFKGSGTSQATAVVSGAAALLLQARPTLTPDQVKKLLTGTATPMPLGDLVAQGSGQLNIGGAVAAPTPGFTAVQTFPASTGTGTIEGARGSAHVVDPDSGVELTGEKDIMGQAWKPATWAAACVAGTAWVNGTWNGRTWSGTGWTGTSWTSRTWSSGTWSGTNWAGRTWSGRTWSDAVWDGRTWSGRTWSGTAWSGRTWSGDYWSGASWE